MPDPVLEDRPVSLLRARPPEHRGHVADARDATQPDRPAGSGEHVPRRADDRRDEQARAEVHHVGRSEGRDLLGAARLLRVGSDHAHDDELQAGERRCGRSYDHVEAFPGGERRYPFHPGVPSLHLKCPRPPGGVQFSTAGFIRLPVASQTGYLPRGSGAPSRRAGGTMLEPKARKDESAASPVSRSGTGRQHRTSGGPAPHRGRALAISHPGGPPRQPSPTPKPRSSGPPSRRDC